MAELESELWLLTHPDLRHLARIKAALDFLGSPWPSNGTFWKGRGRNREYRPGRRELASSTDVRRGEVHADAIAPASRLGPIASTPLGAPAQPVVHECELLACRGRQHEGVEVRQAHGAVDVIHSHREGGGDADQTLGVRL